MANMNLNGRPNGQAPPSTQQTQANSSAKLYKDKDAGKEKKRHHFGFGKKDKY